MRLKRRLVSDVMQGAIAMLLLSACNGVMDEMYDEPLDTPEQTVTLPVAGNGETVRGRIQIDATDYTEWHYINLHDGTITTLPVDGGTPENWDFAIHRYDAKTNGGAVVETSGSDIEQLPAPAEIPSESFVSDVWTTERIIVDMSQMMNNIILYAEDYYNEELSRWLDVDTSTMPPIYTLSHKVYMLRLQDGTYAALKLSNFMSDSGDKGFMTVDYVYPVKI